VTWHRSVPFNADRLMVELSRGMPNDSCFDADGESEGVGRDGVRVQVRSAEPGSARPSLRFAELFEGECS
jgi:hypothetical protein